MGDPLMSPLPASSSAEPGHGGGGWLVRVIGLPVVGGAGIVVTSVLTAQRIDTAGVSHPVSIVPATDSVPLSDLPQAPQLPQVPQLPEEVRVEAVQQIVVHDLPNGQLLAESAVRVVVHQDGAQRVVERHDEQVISKERHDADLVIEQGGAVHLRLDEHGDVTADLTGAVNVTEQPADPTDAIPEGGVVVIQDHDLVVTDFDDGTATDMPDPVVFGDFEQSARTLDDIDDGEVDTFSIIQDQTRTDLGMDGNLGMDGISGAPFHDTPFHPLHDTPFHDTPFQPDIEPFPADSDESFETARSSFDSGEQFLADPEIIP